MSTVTLDSVVQAMKAPAVDRTERYTARLEKHLKTLDDDGARREFCRKELANWVELYRKFADAVDAGRPEPKLGGPTAFDYTETITAIGQIQNRYSAAVPA